MALDWIPTFPSQVPHRRFKQPGLVVGPFTVSVIPVPVVPGLLAFQATYPNQVPHRHSQVARTERVTPTMFTGAIAPVSWAPTFPNQVPHRHLATAARTTIAEPPPSANVVIGQQLAWQARYPSIVPHRIPLQPGGETAPPNLLPGVEALGCLELVDVTLTSPALLEETLTAPTFLHETLGSPALLDEDLC
jgi:hypothetical protein